MAKKILLGAAGAIVLLLIVIAVQPATYRVERTMNVAAPAPVVFGFVSDFKKFVEFSPWEKLDPDMEKTFEGPEMAVGATYGWSGNEKAGKGSMKITALVPNESVTFALEFVEPFASTATTGFSLASKGDTVDVTWFMEGNNDFVGKAICLVVDMDAMLGGQFEEGLTNLKKLAEDATRQVAAAPVEGGIQPAAAGDAAAADAAAADTAAEEDAAE